jgi:hypothetical protein
MITVYGYRKPTLTLELVAGGSLLANTTYNVVGMMKQDPATYCAVSSPLSDVYSITTSSTQRSIRITQRTYRSITKFEDGGSGKTLVTCPRHCLITNDTIKIGTGSYTGSWTVTKTNYNQFTINKVFVDNIPVDCYTDSTYYNKPPTTIGNYHNAIGMAYWVHTSNPYDISGKWVGGNYWTDRAYTLVNTIYNPLTVTSQPNTPISGTNNLTLDRLNNGLFKPISDEYGTIVVGIDSSTTLEEIHNEIQNSGFIYNSHYSLKGKETFIIVGSVVFVTTGALNATGANITVVDGEFYHRNLPNQINLTGCMINVVPDTFSAYFNFNAPGSVFYNNAATNTTSLYIYGDGATLYEAPRFAYNSCDIPNLKYTDLVTGAQKNYGIVQNKEFKDIGAAMIGMISYMSNKLVNCKTFPIRTTLQQEAAGSNPDIYMMENVYIKKSGTTAYHLTYTSYEQAYPFLSHIKYLNVNTDELDNRKKCTGSPAFPIILSFYRRVQFIIKDVDGSSVVGAVIIITDLSNNSYIGVTDQNGYLFLDVLEQLTDLTDVPNANWNPVYDTIYSDFSITIQKEGFETEQYKIETFFTNEKFNISLKVTPTTVTIQSVVITDCTSNGSNDGKIEIIAETNKESIIYSMDGIDFQVSNLFVNLLPGNYTVYAKSGDVTAHIEDILITEPLIQIQYSGAYIINASVEQQTIEAMVLPPAVITGDVEQQELTGKVSNNQMKATITKIEIHGKH